MQISIAEILHNKAKEKKDGIYDHKPFTYVVKGNKFIAFANRFSGECYRHFGSFNVKICKVERYEIRNKLKELLKQKQY